MSGAKFRPATVHEYVLWLALHLQHGGRITHAYDYPFPSGTFLVAQQDFTTAGECGSLARHIIVPPGVSHIGGDLGHCTLFLMEGATTRSRASWVPIYGNPEFDKVKGAREAREEEQRRRREWDAERQALDHAIGQRGGDLATYAGAKPSSSGYLPSELQPLHAHEITPDDAAFIRTMASARFAADTKVTLPSGRQITGAEMQRWLDSEGRQKP